MSGLASVGSSDKREALGICCSEMDDLVLDNFGIHDHNLGIYSGQPVESPEDRAVLSWLLCFTRVQVREAWENLECQLGERMP